MFDAPLQPVEASINRVFKVGLEERRLKLVRAKVLPERIQALSNQVHVQDSIFPLKRICFETQRQYEDARTTLSKEWEKKTFSKKVRRGLFLKANIKDKY